MSSKSSPPVTLNYEKKELKFIEKKEFKKHLQVEDKVVEVLFLYAVV